MGEEPPNKDIHPLQQAREACGFTQRQLAMKLGLPGNGNKSTVTQISYWECGLKIPSYDQAKRLAEVLIFDSAEEVQQLCQEWYDQHQEAQRKNSFSQSSS